MKLLRRDGENPDKMRSPQQCLADAVYELVTNREANTGKTLDHATRCESQSLHTVDPGGVSGRIKGHRPPGHVEMIGTGPVLREILEALTPDTELAGIVFDGAGRPLWLGRNQRLGNAAQRLAIAVRDGGCWAPMQRCEPHHIREWHRDGGRTDVDNLVAVCRRHHRWL